MSGEGNDYSNMNAEQLNELLKDTTDEAVKKQKKLSQMIQESEDPLNPEHIKTIDSFTKEKLKPLDEKYDAILAKMTTGDNYEGMEIEILNKMKPTLLEFLTEQNYITRNLELWQIPQDK